MTSNVTLNAPTVGGGQTIASEDISGVQFQRIKLALGASGADLGDVSNVNPLTVQMGGASVGAFGDLLTSENTPLLQMDFVYGINTQTGVSAVLNSAVVDTNAFRLRLQSGTNAAGSAIFYSRRIIKYRAGQGMTVRFTTVYTTGVTSSTQIMGFGTAQNGYFFGFNGTAFGVLHRNNGADTWVAQAAWNGDKCNGSGVSGFTIDPTKGNVFQIRYPYLGYGVITFWILDPASANWLLCHTIRYPNTATAVQLSNPNLRFYAQVLNDGNNTNLAMYCGSIAALLSGPLSFIGNAKGAADNNKGAVTAETNLLSIRNCTTYNGVPNYSLIRINQISFANGSATATVIGTLRTRIGATVGGSPAFTAKDGTTADNGVTITNGNSVASVDTAGTTVTGGTYIFNISASASGTNSIDVSNQNIFIAPGETLTFGGFATASSTQVVSCNWSEDI